MKPNKIKTITVTIILIIITGGLTYAISTYPSGTPAGEVSGGGFSQYLNKILVDDSASTDGKVKASDKCEALLQGDCGTGEALQGFDTNGIKICVPK